MNNIKESKAMSKRFKMIHRGNVLVDKSCTASRVRCVAWKVGVETISEDEGDNDDDNRSRQVKRIRSLNAH